MWAENQREFDMQQRYPAGEHCSSVFSSALPIMSTDRHMTFALKGLESQALDGNWLPVS